MIQIAGNLNCVLIVASFAKITDHTKVKPLFFNSLRGETICKKFLPGSIAQPIFPLSIV